VTAERGSERPVETDGPTGTTVDVSAAADAADPASDAATHTSARPIERVVWVVAHPDDETLTAGGLLAALAGRCAVTLVTCTRGERGEMIGADLSPLVGDPVEMAGYRTGELDRALTALGIADHLFLDTVDGGPRLVDSGMSWDEQAPLVRALPAPDAGPDAFTNAPLDRVVGALVTVLDRVRPDLVIVDEPGGGYGHPDHRRTHEVTMLAVERAAHRPPLVAWPVRPLSAVHAAHEFLRTRADLPRTGVDGQPLALSEPDGPTPSIVVPDDEVDVEIDVEQQLPAVVAAMVAHRSQVQAVGLAPDAPSQSPAVGWYALSNGRLQPILRRAWLRAAPGWGDRQTLSTAIGATLGGPAPVTAAGRWYRPTMIVFSLILGVVVAAVGTAFHRTSPPVGLIVGLVALAAGGALARTFVDRTGQLCFGGAAVVTVFTMTYLNPGGDVLVTGEPLGIAWIIGSIVAAALVPALLPRRWFQDD
jgi:N-acetyl-1-D-myo-inositol-2-amino-2-deoxy-alpha-D-glucopyranoside deacetylase